MEAARKRVTDEAQNVMESVDKELLRKMQVDMFQCSIKCCENTSSSMADKDSCLEACSSKINQAQVLIQDQINNFQERLHRCSSDCVDRVKDKATTDVTEEKIEKLKGQLDQCIINCADSHIKLLPDMHKRIKNGLAKYQY